METYEGLSELMGCRSPCSLETFSADYTRRTSIEGVVGTSRPGEPHEVGDDAVERWLSTPLAWVPKEAVLIHLELRYIARFG